MSETDASSVVRREVNINQLAERLEGRDGGLRPSKPNASGDDELTQFVWRMAQFHAGTNTSMPVTATFWLQNWLDSRGVDASVTGIVDDEGEAVLDELESVVDEVLKQLGEDPAGGAKRWKKAGLF